MSTELRPTPETDAAKFDCAKSNTATQWVVSLSVAQRIERQRDEARVALEQSCDDEHRLSEEVARLRVQRDELLAALGECKGWTHRAIELEVSFSMQEAQRFSIKRAEAAIAAVEGGGK